MANKQIIPQSLFRRHFNAAGLTNLAKYTSFHLENIKVADTDVRLLRQSIKPVYVIDFQELHTYIYGDDENRYLGRDVPQTHPTGRQYSSSFESPSDFTIVSEFLDDIPEPFLFLKGTWQELIRRILDDVDTLEYVRNKKLLKNLSLQEREMSLHSQSAAAYLNPENETEMQAAEEVVQSLAELEGRYQKLDILIKSPMYFRLQPYFNQRKFIPDEMLYNSYVEYLDTTLDKDNKKREREGKNPSERSPHSNKADAANLALIESLNRYFENEYTAGNLKECFRFYLVTHTKTLLGLPASHSIEISDMSSKFGAINVLRTPLNAIYLRYLESHYPNPYARQSQVRVEKANLVQANNSLTDLKNDILGSQDVDIWQNPTITREGLEWNEGEQKLPFGHVRAVIKSQLLTEMNRSVIASLNYRREFLCVGNSEFDEGLRIAKRVGSLITGIMSSANQADVYPYGQDYQSIGKGQGTGPEEEGIRHYSLQDIEGDRVITLGQGGTTAEYRAFERGGGLMLGFDFYPEAEVISSFWRNSLTSQEFLQEIGNVFDQLGKRGIDLSFLFPDDSFQLVFIQLDGSMSRHKIFGKYKFSGKIDEILEPSRLVRIDFSGISFCCEIIPPDGEKESLLGMILNLETRENVNVMGMLQLFYETTTLDPQFTLVWDSEIEYMRKCEIRTVENI